MKIDKWWQRRNTCKPRLSCNESKLNIKTDSSIWWQRRSSASSEFNIWLSDPLQPETKEQHAIVCRIHLHPPPPPHQTTDKMLPQPHTLPRVAVATASAACHCGALSADEKTESGRGGGRCEGGRRNEMRGGDEQKNEDWMKRGRNEMRGRRRRGGEEKAASPTFARCLCENSI